MSGIEYQPWLSDTHCEEHTGVGTRTSRSCVPNSTKHREDDGTRDRPNIVQMMARPPYPP